MLKTKYFLIDANFWGGFSPPFKFPNTAQHRLYKADSTMRVTEDTERGIEIC